MKRTLLVFAAALALTGCTVGQNRVEGMLAADGYTDIDVGGNALWGCSEGDDLTQTFQATKNGYRVRGVVCARILGKAPTIRVQSTKKL